MKVTTDSCLFGAWVAYQINKEGVSIHNCLDIGTGTGLLTLMLAQKINAAFDAIEIDKNAAEQALENVAASPWKNRITLWQQDAKEIQDKKTYDVIISNPPFYENELKSENNQKNIAHHSEQLTLSDLLQVIKKKLNPDGIFFLLLPVKRNDEIKPLLQQNGLAIRQLTFVRQSLQHDYFRVMLCGKNIGVQPKEIKINEMAIKQNNGEYTQEFSALLKDYYLYL